MKVLENWIRPWKGELIVGQVVVISGDSILCRTASGFEFRVARQDVIDGKVDILDGDRAASVLWAKSVYSGGYRLTEGTGTS